MAQTPYARAIDVWREVAEIIRPPRRIQPIDAVRQFLRTEKGEYDPNLAPMMVEPLNILSGRQYTGIVFVGPSRTSKTFTLVIGGMTYVVTCAPGDMQITHMSEDAARTMSKTDIDRAIRHSPELASRLSPRPRDDNVYDKWFRSGMSLQMAWPTVRHHSAKTLKYIFLTDYDRVENRDDVGGEGTLWDIAYARIRTFMSRGKCLGESSPGGEYRDPSWAPRTPHEAPPTTGILSIYNRGTRARWYWPCQHCGEFFQAQPGFANFKLPPFEELEREVQRRDLMWLAEQFAQMPCPHCAGMHTQDMKPAMNARGVWLHEGEQIDGAGRVTGERRRTDIASYWQGGCSAVYMTWTQLLFRYFQALLVYVRTSDEGALKAVTNTDSAAPYLPRVLAKRRTAEELVKRLEDWPRATVPKGVRFLVATVDVQKARFVAQVYGFGVGLETWIVDRFFITGSRRMEGDRTAAIDPASYAEDWQLLIEEVIERRYPLAWDPQRTLHIELTLCDSGGSEGVTENAYRFWRSLRDEHGINNKCQLVKGDGRLNVPRVQQTWPDARNRKDRRAGAIGDVPVWQVNVNLLKDAIVADLGREQPGPGYVHIPRWLHEEHPDFFDELMSETRDEKGRWVNEEGKRNEAFDLHVYARAACIILRADAIDWNDPPAWAQEPGTEAKQTEDEIDLSALARQLNT